MSPNLLSPEVIAHLRRVNQLTQQVVALAHQTTIMPIQEIRLAAQLAEQAGEGDTKRQDSVILPCLMLLIHDNFHVRRVAVNTIRRIGRFDTDQVLDNLITLLDDVHPWVQHDAAWALEASGTDREDALDGLRRLASGESQDHLDDDDRDGKAATSARERAAQALSVLSGRPGQSA